MAIWGMWWLVQKSIALSIVLYFRLRVELMRILTIMIDEKGIGQKTNLVL